MNHFTSVLAFSVLLAAPYAAAGNVSVDLNSAPITAIRSEVAAIDALPNLQVQKIKFDCELDVNGVDGELFLDGSRLVKARIVRFEPDSASHMLFYFKDKEAIFAMDTSISYTWQNGAAIDKTEHRIYSNNDQAILCLKKTAFAAHADIDSAMNKAPNVKESCERAPKMAKIADVLVGGDQVIEKLKSIIFSNSCSAK